MRLLLLLLCLPAPARALTSSEASELRNIPLVRTGYYDPREADGRGMTRFFNGIAIRIGGPGKDLKAEVLKQLNQEAIRKYFPDARERNEIARRIANGMERNYLSRGYSNANALAAQRYATNELIRVGAKRILETEGVKDPQRIEAWTVKVLAPFNECMRLARAYSEGSKCSTPFERDLVENLGLAMTYEMIRQEFGKDLARRELDRYKACIKPKSRGSDQRVHGCAIQSFRSAVKSYGRVKIEEVARKQAPASADRVVARVMPEFERCVDRASDRAGFSRCAGATVSAAGAEVVAETIRTDPRVRSYFKTEAEVNKLAETGRATFSRCMKENEARDSASQDGTFGAESCGLYTKQETLRSMAMEFFRAQLVKNMPEAPPAERDALLKDVGAGFDECWDSYAPEKKNAPCLRNAALRLIVAAAGSRIDRELPEDVRKQHPKLRGQLIADFDSCLEKRFPENVLEATNAEAVALSCANGLMSKASVIVAEQKVRSALAEIAGELPDKEVVDDLVGVFVHKGFVQCLGENPNEETLGRCSLSLQKNLAMQVANALLPLKVTDFLGASGGPEAFGLTEEQADEITKQTLAGHKACLKNKVNSRDAGESSQQVNDCFKETIRGLSLRLGPLEFDRAARENKIDTSAETFKNLQEQFVHDLGACLDEKKDRKFPLTDYLAGVDACQAKLTKFLTMNVARSELTRVAGDLLQPASATMTDGSLDRLTSGLDGCLGGAKDAAGRASCMAAFRSESTVLLVTAGVRERAFKELGKKEVPAELAKLEDKFAACVKEKKDADACGKAHVLAASAWLGKRVMRESVAPDLGPAMASLEPDLRGIEERYESCLAKADATLEKKLLEQIEACSVSLTEAAFELLVANAAPPGADSAPQVTERRPATSPAQAADHLTRSLLCLNGGLGAEHADSLAQVDPESVESELLKLMGSYIEYDLEKARGQYEQVLLQAGKDLKAAGPEEARRKLLDSLVRNGMADQLVKAVLHAELSRALAALPPGQRPPEELAKAALGKEAFERSLTPEAMARLRPLMAEGVLQPVVVEGKTLRSAAVLRSLRTLKASAAEELLRSPELAPWKSDSAAWERLELALASASK